MAGTKSKVIASELAEEVLRRTGIRPGLGMVLGSGYGAAAREMEVEVVLRYAELPGFVGGAVAGHAGELRLGRWGGVPVVVLAGRAHYYEGYTLDEVTFPIRVLASMGVRAVLLTNAAGGIRPEWKPGAWVLISDHLNWMGQNPLRGPGGGERFVDLTTVYSPRLRELLRFAAKSEGLALQEGIYAAVSGPSYETPAEVRALSRLGADLVGMSTVPEAIVARQCGMEVAGLSCVTNPAAGLGAVISHDEVLSMGKRVSGEAGRLLSAFVRLYDQSAAKG